MGNITYHALPNKSIRDDLLFPRNHFTTIMRYFDMNGREMTLLRQANCAVAKGMVIF